MKKMLNLQLREKILLGFGLVMLILLVVFVVSLSSLLKLGKASEAILKQNYLSIEAMHKMLDNVEQHYRLVYEHYIQKSEASGKAIVDVQLDFEQWLLVEKSNITERGELEASKQLEQAYRDYIYRAGGFQQSSFSSPEQAYRYLDKHVRPGLNTVRDYCMQIAKINQDVMTRSSQRAKTIAHKATFTLVVIGLLGLLLAAVLSLTLSSLIVRPLKNMLAAMDKVSKGDYSARTEYRASDELGIVSGAFDHMAQKLSEYHEMNIRSILREKQINEAILQKMDDGLFLLDTEFHIANANLSGARFFDSTPTACKGRHVLELIRNEAMYEFIKTTAAEKKPPSFLEGQNILVAGQGGSRQYLQFFLTPVFLQPEELLGVMILLQDITHLKQLDKLKSEFLMIASHELKTPLTSINMSISLLKESAETKLSEAEQELLQIAVEDTNRLKALINDLLDISKIEAGKIELSFESIPAEAIVSKALHSFQTEAANKQIELQGDFETGLQVRGDFSKIAWIMTNLLSNALRFTPEKGKIEIRAARAGSFAQFSVADNGIGIPYEHQNKIFDKFYQVPSPRNIGGTGLGLSICREIVRAHGGTIWVESEPGRGSTFIFTLPLADQT